MPPSRPSVRALRAVPAALAVATTLALPATAWLQHQHVHPAGSTSTAAAAPDHHQHAAAPSVPSAPVHDHAAAAPVAPAHEHGAAPAAAPHGHAAHAAAAAPPTDHTAMAILSGQTDGPSSPTNVEPGAGTVAAQPHPAGHRSAAATLDARDAAVAVLLVAAALLLAGTAGRFLSRRSAGLARLAASPTARALGGGAVAALALAVAAPGHGALVAGGAGPAWQQGFDVLVLALPVTLLGALAAGGVGRALRGVGREVASGVGSELSQGRGPTRPGRALLAGGLASVLAAVPLGVAAGASPAAAASANGVCPAGARAVTYDLAAFSVDIPLNGWGDHLPDGAAYALAGRDARVGVRDMQSNPNLTQPVVVRANLGDCITVVLRNDLSRTVGIHPEGLVQLDPETSDGARVGRNPDTAVRPGGSRTYTWYADKLGEAPLTDVVNLDASDEDTHTTVQDGLYGAVVVHPAGSVWTNPVTGANLLDAATNRAVETQVYADVATPTGSLRSYAVVFLDENEDVRDRTGRAPTFPTTGLPDSTFGLNYRAEPLRNRLRAVLEHRGTKTPENPTGTPKTIRLPNGRTFAPIDHFCDGYVPELGAVVADPGAKCLGEESHLQSWVFGDEG